MLNHFAGIPLKVLLLKMPPNRPLTVNRTVRRQLLKPTTKRRNTPQGEFQLDGELNVFRFSNSELVRARKLNSFII